MTLVYVHVHIPRFHLCLSSSKMVTVAAEMGPGTASAPSLRVKSTMNCLFECEGTALSYTEMLMHTASSPAGTTTDSDNTS